MHLPAIAWLPVQACDRVVISTRRFTVTSLIVAVANSVRHLTGSGTALAAGAGKWFGLVWFFMFCYVLVWFGLVWFVLVWFGLVLVLGLVLVFVFSGGPGLANTRKTKLQSNNNTTQPAAEVPACRPHRLRRHRPGALQRDHPAA